MQPRSYKFQTLNNKSQTISKSEFSKFKMVDSPHVVARNVSPVAVLGWLGGREILRCAQNDSKGLRLTASGVLVIGILYFEFIWSLGFGIFCLTLCFFQSKNVTLD